MNTYDFSNKTGPFLFSRILKKYNLHSMALPYHYFYPFYFREANNIFKEIEIPPDSYSIHLNNTTIGVECNKEDKHSDNCIFAKLKKMYLKSD